MKPKFTSAQLVKQNRWRREEQFSLSSTILNILALFPFITILLPFLPFVAATLALVDLGLTANRKNVLNEDQRALNAKKKEILIKKGELLNELDKYDKVENQLVQSPTSFSSKEIAVTDVAKKRHIDTALVKPTNIMLNALKIQATPSNVGYVHKR
jgi:hypothetical protein